MIVGDVSLPENYAVVATSEHPIPDCVIVRSLILKENRMSISWLHDCRELEPEWKLNTNFLTACLSGTWFQHGTEVACRDWTFMKRLRGLLNASWQLSFIQHAWNHCESWDVWYVRQIIGLCYLDSNSRPIQSRLVSLDSDTKFQNNSASRQNRTLPPFTLVNVLSSNRITVCFDRVLHDL